MSPADAVPFVLLLLFGAAIGIGAIVVWLAIHLNRQVAPSIRLASTPRLETWPAFRRFRSPGSKRPTIWLAIRSRDQAGVFKALALSDPTPCAWSDGMAGDKKLFIAPPIRGWVLVVGTALPNPAEDVDACFRFLIELSRKLGHVQLFQADPVLHRHAWARVESGRVIRAYAWADTTVWNQGVKTAVETRLGVKCFSYGDEIASAQWGMSEILAANVEKVPLLAAGWSVDAAELGGRMPPHALGIFGKPSARY